MKKIKVVRRKGLVDIGSCSIHTIHNGFFFKGMHELGEEASDLITSIYINFLMDGVKTSEQFKRILTSQTISLSSTALQDGLALKLFGILFLSYFLKFVPQKRLEISKNSNVFKRIVGVLKLLFIYSSAKLLHALPDHFRKISPLIHVHICKPEVVSSSKKNLNSDIFVEPNLLPLKNTVCGDGISEILKSAPEKDQLCFLKNVQRHYVHACKYIIGKHHLTL
ncbi:hypothetical protein PR048_003693 [Dryococelus australis]|uniref:Uncharacterized protein n=1 Tax=Dryococelus australis TaxID=614101 RepID=A0ABQ9INT9_9NEOP|nr:hypothetical protein PR048_003693 [Dryococelus australis]